MLRGGISDGLIFDAVRIRLLEIGEAVKALPAGLLDTQPSIPWRQIAGMRDHLAHRYFDTAHAILQATVDDDLRVFHPALWPAVAAWRREAVRWCLRGPTTAEARRQCRKDDRAALSFWQAKPLAT